PSTMTTRPFPWDSPAVRKRSTLAMVPTPPCAPTELFDDLLALAQPELVVAEQERPAVGAWVQGDHLQVAAEGLARGHLLEDGVVHPHPGDRLAAVREHVEQGDVRARGRRGGRRVARSPGPRRCRGRRSCRCR